MQQTQQQQSDDLPVRFTDSPQHYLPSTLSTTSGLGSNYTTSGMSGSMGGSTQPPTPSPRRKTSSTSLSEVPELQQQRERLDNRQPIYIPGNYIDYRSHQEVIEHIQNPGGYFGKFIYNSNLYINQRNINIFQKQRIKLFSLSTRSESCL